MSKISKCIFCGSTGYGKGCPFSSFSDRIHLHTGDPTKCSFCGSSETIGGVCPHSPNKRHIAGANFFNQMAQESFITSYLMTKLSEPITDSNAFKRGLVDSKGHLVKRPQTLEEKMAYTSIDAYIFKLRNLLGSKIDMINEDVYLEASIQGATQSIDDFEHEIKFKSDMEFITKRFQEAINEALINNLNIVTVEKIILESFKKS